MRVYDYRPRPGRLFMNGHGLGQPPASLVGALTPGAKAVADYDAVVAARDRLVFRADGNTLEIAFLGTISPGVSVLPGQNVMLGYVYGPKAGTSEWVPLGVFTQQGWRVVALPQEAAVARAGGIYKKPVYPYTMVDVDDSLDVVDKWLKTGTAQAEADNIEGAKNSLARAYDNIDIAWHRLGVVRDSGAPYDLVDAVATLVRSTAQKAQPLQTAIRESDAGLMAKIGRGILDFFSANVPAVQRAFSDKHALAREKVIGIYSLRQKTRDLLRGLLTLPQTGQMPVLASSLSAELTMLNQSIARIENAAAKYGMKVGQLFDIPDATMAGLGAFFLAAPAWLAAAIGAKAAAVTMIIVTLAIEAIIGFIIYLITGEVYERVLESAEVKKAQKVSQRAFLSAIESEFARLIQTHPGLDEAAIKRFMALAYDKVAVGEDLTNMEDLKKLADERMLRVLEKELAARGKPPGVLPSEEGEKKKARAAEPVPQGIILALAGAVVFGPVLASLFKNR